MGVPDLFVSSFLPTFFICHVFISFFSIHFLLYFSPPCLSPSLIYVAILKNVNSGEETKQLSNNLTTATTIDRTHYLLWQILLFVHPCFCFFERPSVYIYYIYRYIFSLRISDSNPPLRAKLRGMSKTNTKKCYVDLAQCFSTVAQWHNLTIVNLT